MSKSLAEAVAEIRSHLGSDFPKYESIMRDLAQLRESNGGRLALTRTGHMPELGYGPPPGCKLAGRYRLTDSSIVRSTRDHLTKNGGHTAVVFTDEDAKEFVLYRSMTFAEF